MSSAIIDKNSTADEAMAALAEERNPRPEPWTAHGMANADYDTCQRCGRRYGTFQPECPNIREHAPRHKATVQRLTDLLKQIAVSYPDDPNTSDLDDDQPVTVSLNLGQVRLARRLI